MTTPVLIFTQDFEETSEKNLCMLWKVYSLMGLNVSEGYRNKKCTRLSRMIQKLSFPLLMTCNMVYVVYCMTIRFKSMNYAFALDILMTALPNVMWFLMHNRKMLLIHFLSHLRKMSNQIFFVTPINNCFVNGILFCAFMYPISVATFNLYPLKMDGAFNKGSVKTHGDVLFEYMQKAQEMIFPSILALTYTTLCYIFVRHLRFYHSEFSKTKKLRPVHQLKTLTEGYLEVVNGLQLFQDIFSSPLFFLMWQNFCVVSYLALKAINEGFQRSTPEEILFMCHACTIIGSVTVCAAEVPLLMQRIRLSLLNLSSRKIAKDEVDSVLQIESTVLTACNVFVFERGFLLKAIGAVVAQAVIFHQVVEK